MRGLLGCFGGQFRLRESPLEPFEHEHDDVHEDEEDEEDLIAVCWSRTRNSQLRTRRVTVNGEPQG